MVQALTYWQLFCRRMNALRHGLSGSQVRLSGTLEIPDSVSTATHVSSRRRRHRRNGSFGSLGYPAAQTAQSPLQHAASTAALAAAEAIDEQDAPESSAASRSKPGSSLDALEAGPEQAELPRQTQALQADAAAWPPQHDSSRASFERGDHTNPRDSAATELPEEWVTALHSLDSSEAASQPISGNSEAHAASTGSGNGPAPVLKARTHESRSSLRNRYTCFLRLFFSSGIPVIKGVDEDCLCTLLATHAHLLSLGHLDTSCARVRQVFPAKLAVTVPWSASRLILRASCHIGHPMRSKLLHALAFSCCHQHACSRAGVKGQQTFSARSWSRCLLAMARTVSEPAALMAVNVSLLMTIPAASFKCARACSARLRTPRWRRTRRC